MRRYRLSPPFARQLPVYRIVFIVVLLVILVVQCGCSSFNCTRLENVLGGDTNLIEFSYRIADQLAERALPPLVPYHANAPILVTTFVNNNNLQQTSHFGRILQEHVASRFVQLGYTVREIKLADTLHIEPLSGETILSRDLRKLGEGQQAQAILVGTISRTDRILYISARLINPANNNITATSDYKLCMDDDIRAMFGVQRKTDIDLPIDTPRQPFLNSIL